MKLKKFISVLCAVSVFSVSAMSVAAASNYTPSVTKKDSITITEAVDDEGNKIEIIVTPVSKSEDTPTDDAKEQMDKAFEEIKSAVSLDKLAIKGNNPFTGKKKDYVVSQLFDVSLKGIDNSYFDGGKTITVTFTINDLSTDIDSIWLHRYSTDGKWRVMDVTKSGTNSYTTTFSTLSPVAICVPASTGSVTSPQTGDTTNYMLYVIVALSIPAFAGAAVFARKKLAE